MGKSRDPLGRSAQILRHLVEAPAPTQGVREIAMALEMQPSTVSRLLSSLHEERLVQRDPETGGYSPHLDLIRLGLLTSQKLDVRSVARPYLQEIANASNETVFLARYDPDAHQMLRVDSVQSSNPLRYVVEMDRWTEVYRGASGLGILAFLPEDERQAIIAVSDAAATDDEPWLRRDALEPFLKQIRRQGYACTHGRRIPGAVGISAPFFGPTGRVLGDVILTMPESRFDASQEAALARLVIDGATGISHDLGGRVATN